MFLMPRIPRSFFLLWGDSKRNCCPEIRYGLILHLNGLQSQDFFFPYLYCTILKKSTNVWFIKGILLAHSVFKEENISHLGFHCSQSFDKLCKTIKLNFLWLIKANYIHFNSVGEPQFSFFSLLTPLVNSSEHFIELLFREHLYINSSLIIHH